MKEGTGAHSAHVRIRYWKKNWISTVGQNNSRTIIIMLRWALKEETLKISKLILLWNAIQIKKCWSKKKYQISRLPTIKSLCIFVPYVYTSHTCLHTCKYVPLLYTEFRIHKINKFAMVLPFLAYGCVGIYIPRTETAEADKNLFLFCIFSPSICAIRVQLCVQFWCRAVLGGLKRKYPFSK